MTELYQMPDGGLRWYDPADAPKGAKPYKPAKAEKAAPAPKNKAKKTANKSAEAETK